MTLALAFVFSSAFVAFLGAQEISAEMQSKIDGYKAKASEWAALPAVVNAVKAANATPAPEYAGMTQEKWKGLSILDPLVRAFSKNEAAQALKGVKTDAISELFVSAANGTKVAFLGKTSNWSHHGKPKHEEPMAGKVFQGPVEVDESTGMQQLQIAVPVLIDGKPVGSLIVGLRLAKL